MNLALKPGWEPIILARKPLTGSVAANVLAHGTGALHIEACRLDGLKPDMRMIPKATIPQIFQTPSATNAGLTDEGRWPPNVVLDEAAAEMLDAQTGDLSSGGGDTSGATAWGQGSGWNGHRNRTTSIDRLTDVGGASRFFYVAKPSREERDWGCERLPPRTGGEATDRQDGTAGIESPRAGAGRTGGARNTHPTVKPMALMRWLVRLVTPPGGTVLDPFMGSGTTGMACRAEQVEFLGIEREAEYVRIAEARIAAVAPLFHAPEAAVTVAEAQIALFTEE